MSERSYYFYYTLTVTVILFAIELWNNQPPAVQPASISMSEFSGQRAYNILHHLLQEEQPHPVGSALNKVVKQRIINELTGHGIETSVQATWQCSRNLHACAFIENIIAIIPGRQSTGYVTLMSHYDSVPVAPGAGDDGAAVAAMLETARILKSEAPFDKPIMMLFTDAEEIGLVGAEAFFNRHELAKEISIVLNYEGSGTKGVSTVLRTSGSNNVFMHAFQRESAYAKGASLINEIFKRMPNDTDFSVVRRAELPGIDIAFANERNHYHTPNDNLINIDKRTIQHHGENMLPISRWLASNDYQSGDYNLVYNQFYSGWVEWPTTYTPVIIITAMLFVGVAFLRTAATIKGSLSGFAATLLVLLLSFGVSYGAFEIISYYLNTMVSWPAHDLPFRITLFASGLFGGLLAGLICQRFLNTTNGLTGAMLFWSMLAIVVYSYMPDAANIIVIPLAGTSMVMLLASFFPKQSQSYILPLCLAAVVPTTLGLVLPLEQTQGYRLIFAAMPFTALFMTVFVPLVLGSKLKLITSTLAIVTGIAMVVAINSPLYTEHRPQHVNIMYYQQAGAQTGYYRFQHQNPLPSSLMSVYPISSEKRAFLPYTDYEFSHWAEVPSVDIPSPEARVISVQKTDSGRVVKLMLTSPRAADSMQLLIPRSANLIGYKLGQFDAHNSQLSNWYSDGMYSIRLIGTYHRPVTLTLTLASPERVTAFLLDRSHRLPESGQPLLAQRRGLLGPRHQGDAAQIITKIRF